MIILTQTHNALQNRVSTEEYDEAHSSPIIEQPILFLPPDMVCTLFSLPQL